MKAFQYSIFTLLCILFASCMGADYADPEENGESPYGNHELTETNVISISELKSKFSSVISKSGMQEITEDIKIEGYVTGNDIQGNLYNEISLQDETGAIIVAIEQGGLYGYLPVGQKVLIDLKGLIIGGYGKQPEIGSVYTNTNTGAQSVGRMSRYTWATHYKLIGSANPTAITPEVFDKNKLKDANYLAANCGKLMTIKGVTLKDGDGKKVFAPSDGSVTLTANCANRALKGISSTSMVVRTSIYADFAADTIPQGSQDITGIFTRYNNVWQILMRTNGDITPEK